MAVGCRQMLKEKRYAFPPVKMELAGDFFTILITFAMEAAESEPFYPEGKPQPAPPPHPPPTPGTYLRAHPLPLAWDSGGPQPPSECSIKLCCVSPSHNNELSLHTCILTLRGMQCIETRGVMQNVMGAERGVAGRGMGALHTEYACSLCLLPAAVQHALG